MKAGSLAVLAALAAWQANAQEHREAEAHVHGVSILELAIERGVLEVNLHSPGMDIVGFEYPAESAADKDSVEAAIVLLTRPRDIIALPAAANCRVAEVLAHLHGDDHGHEEHEAGHADPAGEMAADEGAHNEFHARYRFVCDNPEAIRTIGLPFFQLFPNAQEVEVKFVTETTSGAVEVGRDRPQFDLR